MPNDGFSPAVAKDATTQGVSTATGLVYYDNGGQRRRSPQKKRRKKKRVAQAAWAELAVRELARRELASRGSALAKDYVEDDHPRGEHGEWEPVAEPKTRPKRNYLFTPAHEVAQIDGEELREALRDPHDRSVIVSTAIGLWSSSHNQHVGMPLMKRLIEECKPDGLLSELHPGSVTVFRGYRNHPKGLGGISSFSTSRNTALRFAGGDETHVREVAVSADTPALSFAHLHRLGLKEILPENEVVTNKAARIELAKRELQKRKRAKLRIESHDAALEAHQVADFTNHVANFLRTEGNRAADRVAQLCGLAKADDKKSGPAAEDIIEVAADVSYHELVAPAESSLFSAYSTGANIGIGQLEISDAGLISATSPTARDYAHRRAAELVGMRWNANGELAPNPSAAWRIDESTRKELRTLVEKAFDAETPLEDLVNQIRNAGAFSEGRAKTIARTEIARAQSLGTLQTWQTLGTVKTVRWVMSADHDNDDICDENTDAGAIPIGEEFPSGDVCPPAHPNCKCALVAAELADE